MATESKILLYLDDSNSVLTALCLNWKYIMRAPFIYPNIELIGFHLTHIRYSRSQVIL